MSKKFCWIMCIQIILLLRYMILVCGTGALCLTRIHRPLCVCPDGFDGNPYDKCEEVQFFYTIGELSAFPYIAFPLLFKKMARYFFIDGLCRALT